MKPTRVLLADDHPVYRDGLRMILETDDLMEIVAEASTGQEALQRAKECSPQVVVLDINMPDMSGACVAAALKEDGCTSAIIFLTMEKSGVVLQQAIDLGVNGYLLKNSKAQEIIEAVRAVSRGESYYSPSVANLLMQKAQAERSLSETVNGLSSLTPTEKKVLQMVASDRTSKEIAGDLGVSVRTIEGHRARISKKLGLSGAHSLVKFAFEHRDSL